MTAVIDASVVVEMVTASGRRRAAVADRVLAARSLHAPALLDVEVLSAVRRRLARDETTATGADAAIGVLRQLPIARHRHHRLVDRIWALRENVTPSDAAYVALAELLDAPLITLDARLASAPLFGVRFELIEP